MNLDFTFKMMGEKNLLVCTHCGHEWEVPIKDEWHSKSEMVANAQGKLVSKVFKTRDSWIRHIIKSHMETH